MIKRIKKLLALSILILVTILISSCTTENIPSKNINLEPISRSEYVLGTTIDITIYDNGSEKILDKAFNKIKDIEDKMTINGKKSEVIGINSQAGQKFVKVSDETFYVISTGEYFSELSRGRFDISIGPLVKLWNIGMGGSTVPHQDQIDIKKSLVNYKNVLLNEKNKSVMLNKKGMILDLGGIAKGYAADAVAEVLKENGIGHAIMNLGGNIYAYGSKLDGTDWRIGIQNPIAGRNDYLGIVDVTNKTIVTSGTYERYFEENGKRYHHILDPETGYPVENNLLQVSIITNKSINADSLSTSAFALGLQKGLDLIESLDNTEAIFVTNDSHVYVSSGLKENFELTNKNFKLND